RDISFHHSEPHQLRVRSSRSFLLVDTACSSALTAIHLARQAIRNGDCDQAVVAGFNFVPTPLETISFNQLGVLSPDGQSKSFDDRANGYARGDIAGAVVVKRHDKSVKDHDHILATLVGSSLTSCGSEIDMPKRRGPINTCGIKKAHRETH
ncbi:thiolase-like protein, partial [Mycena galopus ATCC 62051]